MEFRFTRLTEPMAMEALTWRYPPPFDFYDPPDEISTEMIATLLSDDSPQYGVFDERNLFIGMGSVGFDAQVPGGDYTEPATDIGIGLRPDACGRGLGRKVIAAFMAFLEERAGPAAYRATIADFNQRSLKSFLALGFTETTRFTTTRYETPQAWVIVMKPVACIAGAGA